MQLELTHMGIVVECEKRIPIVYRDQEISDQGFRLDLLVENTIIVELKSVKMIKDIHKKQLLTYLKLTKKPLGLLINFNEALLKNGITRVINEKNPWGSL